MHFIDWCTLKRLLLRWTCSEQVPISDSSFTRREKVVKFNASDRILSLKFGETLDSAASGTSSLLEELFQCNHTTFDSKAVACKACSNRTSCPSRSHDNASATQLKFQTHRQPSRFREQPMHRMEARGSTQAQHSAVDLQPKQLRRKCWFRAWSFRYEAMTSQLNEVWTTFWPKKLEVLNIKSSTLQKHSRVSERPLLETSQRDLVLPHLQLLLHVWNTTQKKRPTIYLKCRVRQTRTSRIWHAFLHHNRHFSWYFDCIHKELLGKTNGHTK